MAFALAYLLTPLVNWMEKHGLGRRTAIAVVFIGIILTIGLLLFLILPVLYSELTKLAVIMPQTMQSIDRWLQDLRAQFRATGLPDKVTVVIDQHLSRGEGFLAERLQLFLSNLPEKLTSLGLYIFSPILAIYFLVDWHKFQDGWWHLVQPHWRLEWQRLWQDINHVIRRFLQGDLVVAAIVGILIGIGVKLLGMEYALLIGILCGIFDLIPFFGPFIGGIPSVLLGLTKSPMMGLKVALVIFIVQQLEGNVISPKLMGDSVGLHPLWIIFALLAGGEIAGFWGMLLAVPLAAVLKVILRYIYWRLVSYEV